MRRKLEAAGGKIYENVQLAGVEVLSDGVALVMTSQTAPGGAAVPGAGAAGADSGARVQYATSITARLLLDCMGHASPIVKQLRWAAGPCVLAANSEEAEWYPMYMCAAHRKYPWLAKQWPRQCTVCVAPCEGRIGSLALCAIPLRCVACLVLYSCPAKKHPNTSGADQETCSTVVSAQLSCTEGYAIMQTEDRGSHMPRTASHSHPGRTFRRQSPPLGVWHA